MSAHVIGLTGQSGSGKTTVAQEFLRQGFCHIDCDRLVHHMLAEESRCTAALRENFPQFFDGGNFDRRRAAALLFADRDLLDRYNAVFFPFITEEITARISAAEQEGCEFILLDAPTLFEAGADTLCELIVACVSDEENRIVRITERDGIDEESARRRIRSQHSEEFFRGKADIVIENNGSYPELLRSAETAAERIKESVNGKEKEQ
ncbi:dephospho-CoA kinase [Ruminococcus sp. YE71]|uniref:dephospho-CoA kinase n=1 Tax=unclassified Ruminococcus TaxID=2608920 RepID=UPI00087F7821|nr:MULTISPECIES: dephospho-CoA kinase [unclassified Ruminococcus]SDA27303.1 dephospho-CoA kinase [Ruminococcus sp. YE78]SFW45237.1 dephospho-CoA kinase [Ruminococcus sp. YE71]